MLFWYADISYGQQFTREQLKSLEEEVMSAKSDTLTLISYQPQKTNDFDAVAVKTFESIDSLRQFVLTKKLEKTASFEADVIPFLEAKCNALGIETFDFTEDEEQLYDNFFRDFKWDKTVKTNAIYEVFILKNATEKVKCESFLMVLSFLKQLYFYIKSQNGIASSPNYRCFADNFEYNNEFDWKVFALNPGRLILWTMASCAWNTKSEK